MAEELTGKRELQHAVSAGYRICLETQNNGRGSMEKGSYFCSQMNSAGLSEGEGYVHKRWLLEDMGQKMS